MNTDKVLCKRQVVLRSILTDQTKMDIALEFQRAIEGAKQQASQIHAIIQEQKKNNQKIDLKPLEDELKKAAVQEHILKERLEEIKKAAVGDLYTTGVIEGFSTLAKGDDIREKLGNVEIISKDYLIQDIQVQMPEKKAPAKVQKIGTPTRV